MKVRPENWKDLRPEDKVKFITGRSTGVCWCNPALGEACEKCKDLLDIKEEDRNYYEEVLLLIRDMADQSHKSNEYYIFKALVEIDGEKGFNGMIRREFIDYTPAPDRSIEEAMAGWHKSIRQCDYFPYNLQIVREKEYQTEDDYLLAGNLDTILYCFLHMSEIPFLIIKKLIEL